MKLTKKALDALKPNSKETFHWDDELPGFGLRIKPSGVRSFLLQYRYGQGRTRRIVIGRYGELTPEEARNRARAMRQQARDGIDPTAEKREARQALTVKQLCRDYLAECEKGLVLGRGGKPKKESTLISDWGRIERHIIPVLGAKKVRELQRADIKAFMNAVALGKTAKTVKTDKLRGKAIVTGGHGTARRTVGLLGGILSYAVENGHLASNPARGVKRGADGKREFRLSSTEYQGFGRAIESAEQDGEHWQAVAIARLLALTGCRLSEIVKLKKTEFDALGRCLRLADNKIRGAVIPLGQPSVRILSTALARSHPDSPFVFSGVRRPQGAFGDFPNAWERMIGDQFTPHGLRHAFASACDELDMGELTIAALLGHSAAKKGSVTRGYIHKVDSVLLAAADKASRYVWRAMSGETAEVVSIHA